MPFPWHFSAMVGMQDYKDPLFVEQERDKIAQEIVRAFKPELAKMPSQSLYSQFLKKIGLYTGPYADTPESNLERFVRIAEQTHDVVGPRMNFTTDGSKSVYVPGMAKHAFNAGAARMNASLEGWTPEYKQAYQANAKSLEEMAQSVSEAILRKDLNGALTAVYGREWADYRPKSDPKDKSDFDQK